MLVLEGLVGLHRSFQLHLFSVTDWGIDMDYRDIEWFALETKRSFCRFSDCIQMIVYDRIMTINIRNHQKNRLFKGDGHICS